MFTVHPPAHGNATVESTELWPPAAAGSHHMVWIQQSRVQHWARWHVHRTVKWSEFYFLRFRIWTHCCRLAIFSIPIWTRTRRSFHFQKITETLKNNLYLENLKITSFYLKEQSPKRKFRGKLVFFQFYFRPLKWVKRFLTWSMEKHVFEYLFSFSF